METIPLICKVLIIVLINWLRRLSYSINFVKMNNIRDLLYNIRHSVKSVRIRCFSGLYFLAFGLNIEIYFSYPLKTSENQGFSDVFMGYRK